MFRKKKSPVNATPRELKDVIQHESNRFYKMYKLNATSKIGLTLFGIIVAAYTVYTMIDSYMEEQGTRPHIAVISLKGAMGTGSETGDGIVIADALKQAYRNPNVKAILIEAESGGGGPSDAVNIYDTLQSIHQSEPGIQILRDNQLLPVDDSHSSAKQNLAVSNLSTDFQRVKSTVLTALKTGQGAISESDLDTYKPVIVSVKTMCASACYYAVSAADAIFADRTAIIGSIGVRMDHWDFSEVMHKVGVKNNTLTAGSYKDALDPWHPMTEDSKVFMETELLSKMHQTFISDIERARKNTILSRPEAELVNLYSGRIWLTPSALSFGLIDAEVTTSDIKSRLSQIYGTKKFRVYNEPRRTIRSALGMTMDNFNGAMLSISRMSNSITAIADNSDIKTLK